MRNDNTQKLVWAGLFTAITTVATMFIRFPIPTLTNGYVNAGDAMVILSAFFLGPGWGAFAAGLGSALADVLGGFVAYFPGTLIIKALMTLTAGAILRKAKEKQKKSTIIFGGIVAELIMIIGYFIFESIFLGYGWGALAEILPNLAQAICGVAVGTVLFYALLRIPYVKKTF